MSPPPVLPDPFALTANLAAYVPRAATERALAELEGAIRTGRNPAALTGPPGLGKTLLLHLVAARLGRELHPVYLPYGALPPYELAALALGMLDRPHTDDDPAAALRAFADELHAEGSALLLLVDDASSMPLETARWLGELARASGGAVRLVMAAMDSRSAGRTVAAVGGDVVETRLVEPMSEEESREYVLRRLELAGVAPDVRRRFHRRTLANLHRISAGIPRRLHMAATAVVRGAAPSVPEDAIFESAREHAEAGRGAGSGATLEAPLVPGGGPVGPAAEAEARARAELALEPETWEDEPGLDEALDAELDDLEDEPFEDEESDAWLEGPPRARLEPPPSGRRVFLTMLVVAGAAIAVPLLRAQVSVGTAPPPPLPAPREASAPARVTEPAPRFPAEAGWETLQPGRERAAGGVPPGRVEPRPTPLGAAAERAAPRAVPRAGAPEVLGPFAVDVEAPSGATLEIDGIRMGRPPLRAVPLLGGPHVFRARLPDGTAVERTVRIDASTSRVRLDPRAAGSSTGTPAAATPRSVGP